MTPSKFGSALPQAGRLNLILKRYAPNFCMPWQNKYFIIAVFCAAVMASFTPKLPPTLTKQKCVSEDPGRTVTVAQVEKLQRSNVSGMEGVTFNKKLKPALVGNEFFCMQNDTEDALAAVIQKGHTKITPNSVLNDLSLASATFDISSVILPASWDNNIPCLGLSYNRLKDELSISSMLLGRAMKMCSFSLALKA